MARMRIFIAVDPGDAVRDQLLAVQQNLGRATSEVKWVEENNLHLTLLFLGEVGDRDLVGVCRAVSGVASTLARFPIEVAGVGCFPNLRRPRVVWAGITMGAESMIALHDALESPLLDLGCYRREDRKYTPHLTLGRVKSEQPSDDLAKVMPSFQSWRGGETIVREVVVMSSELTTKGPTYTVLGRGKLK